MKERSVSAYLAEQLLKLVSQKEVYANKEKAQKFIEKKGKNLKPYIPPKKVLKETSNLPINGNDVYLFKGDKEKAIIYIHGGAFINQPLIFHWDFILEMQHKTNATVYAPIYPKIPFATYKETFNLLTKLYKNILKTVKPENITIMGDSAGGNITLAFAMYLKELNLPQPQNLILLSPCLDITFEDKAMRRIEKVDPMLAVDGLKNLCSYWAGDLDKKDYKVSPIYGEIRELGNITLFVGTHDILVCDARRLRDRCRLENIPINYFEYPKMDHVFVVYPVKEGEKAREKLFKIIGLMPKAQVGENVNEYAKKLNRE